MGEPPLSDSPPSVLCGGFAAYGHLTIRRLLPALACVLPAKSRALKKQV